MVPPAPPRGVLARHILRSEALWARGPSLVSGLRDVTGRPRTYLPWPEPAGSLASGERDRVSRDPCPSGLWCVRSRGTLPGEPAMSCSVRRRRRRAVGERQFAVTRSHASASITTPVSATVRCAPGFRSSVVAPLWARRCTRDLVKPLPEGGPLSRVVGCGHGPH